MKLRLTLVSFILCASIGNAQNDITFDLKTKKITPKIKELNLGEKGNIYLNSHYSSGLEFY